MKAKKFMVYFVPACFLFLSILFFARIMRYIWISEVVDGSYPGEDFSRNIVGTNYQFSIPNKTDPAKFCVQQIPGNHEVHISALSYFSIKQGDIVFHAIAVDNSIFEVKQEISGCWEIIRYEDDLLGRLVNSQNTAQIIFESTDKKAEGEINEWLNKVDKVLSLGEDIVLLCLIGNIFLLGVSLSGLIEFAPAKVRKWEEQEKQEEQEEKEGNKDNEEREREDKEEARKTEKDKEL
jgi:hypothetical protein